MASTSARGGSGLTLGGISSWKELLGIARDCPGRLGVLIPGGVQGTPGHGTQCSGLGNKVRMGHRLDSVVCEVFSNLMIP